MQVVFFMKGKSMFDVHTRHTQIHYRKFEQRQLNKIQLMCIKFVAVIILRTLEIAALIE